MLNKIKSCAFTFLLVVFTLFPANIIAASDAIKIDTGDLEKGIIKIASLKDTNKNIKVMISNGGEKYTYDLKSNGSYESFPLQMGNGNYLVSVLENISGNRYSYLKTNNIPVKLNSEDTLFVNSVQNISWTKEGLAATRAAILTKELDDNEAKAKAIYNYVVKNYRYDYPKAANIQSGYIPDIDDTLKTQKGICYDFSSLFAAMCRSQNIPCKLIMGYTKKARTYHAWNEVKIKDKWVVVDTTQDLQLHAGRKDYAMQKNAGDYSKTKEY